MRIKNTLTEVNAFDRLSRLDTAKERISEPEEMSVETSKTEMEIEEKKNLKNRISKNCGAITKGITYT